MKSVTLITKTKITAEKVSKKIIDNYKKTRTIVQNDEGELFLGNFPYEFYIVYADSSRMDDPLCFFEKEDFDKIPFKDALVNELYYHDEKVLKNVLSTILTEYPELYINDEDNNIMSALDFINTL